VTSAGTQTAPIRSMGLVVAAACLFGTIGTIRVLGPDASSWSVGAARLLVGAALLVVLAVAVDGAGELARQARRPVTLLAGVGQAAFQVSFLAAVELTGVAVGTLVAIGSAPVFTGLLTRTVDRTWLAATGLALAGVVLLVGGGSAGLSSYGVLLALTAGLSYALYTVASRSLARAGEPVTSVAAAGFVVAGLLLTPALVFTDQSWLRSGEGLAMLLYLSVVATALAYVLFVAGLRHVPAPVAQTLGLAEPVVATLLGVLVLGERLGVAGVLGALLVMAALALLSRAVTVTA
jgi:DME family drug/metabolite transporter